ncbi:MAG: hypothetical protein WKF95_12785 [Rubrobacter sp.]
MAEGQIYHGRATTLERVIPISEKQKSGGLTLALTSLEIYAEGNGVLRYLMEVDEASGVSFVSIPKPQFVITNDSGSELRNHFEEGSSSDRVAAGALNVFDLSCSGKLTVRVERIGYLEESLERRNLEAEPMEGTWSFDIEL